jgi:hypothetical protein
VALLAPLADQCFFLTTVHMGIRWSDSRLSTVDFSMDFAYPNVQNDNPACLPPQ